MPEAEGFSALKLAPAGACRAVAGERGPACRLPGFRRRSGCVPAEPYPPLERPGACHRHIGRQSTPSASPAPLQIPEHEKPLPTTITSMPDDAQNTPQITHSFGRRPRKELGSERLSQRSFEVVQLRRLENQRIRGRLSLRASAWVRKFGPDHAPRPTHRSRKRLLE